jgi:pyruvate formate lyase activating enzyme
VRPLPAKHCAIMELYEILSTQEVVDLSTFRDTVDGLTIEGSLYSKLEDGSVRCYACGHRCLIHPGRRGICQVRFNQDGVLRVPWGYVAAAQLDPIEKKPFSHVLPGSDALTFGMLGCDFHCGYCQNWEISQYARDPRAGTGANSIQQLTPEQIVRYAQRNGASAVVSSYNEPLITSEWAVGIFTEAKKAGMKCAFVSNGNNTPEVMQYLLPYLDAYKIDLKSMNDKNYRSLGGVLKNVLDGIQRVHDLGLWLEVVTLVVPGFNDSTDELWEAARFLRSVSPDIPWHLTAFHPDYKMVDPPATTAARLMEAAEIAQEAGLNYVYAGNLPGRVGSLEDTLCPKCQAVLVKRHGYVVSEYHITAQGSCPHCGTKVPGVWTEHPESVRLGGWGAPRRIR